jgi:hypothetical protein
MEEKTKEELAEEARLEVEAEAEKAKAEFEAELEGLSDEEKSQKIADKEAEESSKHIDFKKELEKVQEQPKSELEKAQRALHFNAERLKELGGDPADVLKLKKDENKDNVDVSSAIKREFAERDARILAKSDDEYKLIMWYVDNKNVSIEEAHLLANKGRFVRSITEANRARVNYSKPDEGGRKITASEVPARSQEEINLLARRGMMFNSKTKTYQGKFYEEYYDSATKTWLSRKLQK